MKTKQEIYNLTLGDLQSISKNILDIGDWLKKYENEMPLNIVMELEGLIRAASDNLIAVKVKYDN
jgi:hypothetical protein